MLLSHCRVSLLASAMILAGAAQASTAGTALLATSGLPFNHLVQVTGAAHADDVVHFQVALRMRQYDALQTALHQGKRFSAGEMDTTYFPAREDHDAVVAWLRSEGLTVEGTVPSRLAIRVSGSAETVSRVLGVQFARITSEGASYVASSDAPSIPKELAGIILGINGLQPQLHAHTQMRQLSSTTPGAVPYGPADLKNAYTANGLGTGAGSTTAIIIDTFPETSDLTTFWTTFNIPQSLSNITFIQTNPGTLPALSGEESLDTEYSSSIAPAGKVRVYAAQSLQNTALDTTFLAVISDMQGSGSTAPVKITQVSISLGECETAVPLAEANTDDQDFAAMTALGASVFVSSGDSGSKECDNSKNVPSFYSTSPNVAAVGGTTLKMKGTKESSETAWTGGNFIVGGSGGGISTIFAQPAYQKGLPYTKRAVPDLSADANPNTGVLVYVGGNTEQIGGTSVSSPVTAGLIGLVNSNRIAAGKAPVGLLNTDIYPLVLTSNFRDITSGNNGGYKCTVGYDLVTGIGAPLMATLGATLQNLK